MYHLASEFWYDAIRLSDFEMSRPEVVKKIWDYVKANGLQDPNDKRYILCDDSLRPVFGEKVHMLYVGFIF
jgi:upstream activation factor subunit UAF30